MNSKKKFEQPSVASNTVAELSAKLIEANKKLQDAEQERTIMLENISHDLRAPLTAIRSTIDYMRQKSECDKLDLSEDEIRAMINLLDVRAKTLEVLVHEFYYLTCIESGRDDLSLQEVPLAQFLEEYFFAAEIDDKYDGKNLNLDVPENMDALVRIDTAKMSRVLDNLFTNARKYSGDGATITLGAFEKDDSVCFYVRDTGYGIPKESLDHIFKRTYRVSDSRTPAQEASSGLGLTIVKSIVEQHGGTIMCESEYGEGSVFTVSIPRI